jgi:hypothetical protein
MGKHLKAKAYLSQAYYLDKMINAKMEQVQGLKDFAMQVSRVMTGDKVSGGKNESRTEGCVSKWIEIEKEIQADIEHMIGLKMQITRQIEAVKNPKYRLLLMLRYLNFKNWEDITDIMHYADSRWVRRLHTKALEQVEIGDDTESAAG